MRGRVRRFTLVALFLVLLAAPHLLRLVPPGNAGRGFVGSDNRAADAVRELSPGFRPWFDGVLPPPGEKLEGVLFLAQGAIGAMVLFYLLRGRRRSHEDSSGC